MLSLAPRLRASDVTEVWASHRATPDQALRGSLALSVQAGAGVIGGRVECLFGVAPDPGDRQAGIVWLLGSPALETAPVGVLRHSRAVVAGWQQMFPRLWNRVDARNGVSLRWLRWLGFQVAPAMPFGPDGMPFHHVERRRSEQCVQYRV